jgi:hypothetical protein
VNYLAHAKDVLHDPWMVAGTSLPDWLRAVDRKARVRPEMLATIDVVDGTAEARVKAGALKHHDDDLRFHTNDAFEALTHDAVHAIRALAPDEPRLRASALGHIVIEMLLDAVVEERTPGSTARYYEAIEGLDVGELARIVARFTGREVPSLATLMPRFIRARFLFVYATDDGVVDALEGVAWRTGMPPPPPGTAGVVRALRPRVRAAASGWL